MPLVVFACVHNAGRSQMASALFNRAALGSAWQAVSAGTQPAERVHPVVERVLAEDGISLAGVTPQLLTEELAGSARLLVTMGCGEACPVVPGVAREDWPLPDPKGLPDAEVREIRDSIRAAVDDLVQRLPAD